MGSRSTAGALATVLLACGIAAAPAYGENGWNAKLVAQSGPLTLESGQAATSWFRARNVGTRTWASSTVNLGTSSPRDRESAFYMPRRWLGRHRPTRLKEPSVVPDKVGTFEFDVRAPEVNSRREYKEFFTPVADIPDGGWMDTPEKWQNVHLVYTVLPRKAPGVRFASAPQSIRAGDPIDVVAEARDEFAMRHVQFLVDGADAGTVAGAGPSFTASLSSADLPPGPHQLTARAVDHVGNKTDVTHAFEVQQAAPEEPPPPPPPPPPAALPVDADATLKLRLLRRGRVRVLGLSVSAPRGTRVSASCARSRCRQVVGATRRRTTRLWRLRGRVLRRGARIDVRFDRAGARSVVIRFTVGKRTIRKRRIVL
jgi:hypothetical protein